jgi:hypothetical protein
MSGRDSPLRIGGSGNCFPLLIVHLSTGESVNRSIELSYSVKSLEKAVLRDAVSLYKNLDQHVKRKMIDNPMRIPYNQINPITSQKQ